MRSSGCFGLSSAVARLVGDVGKDVSGCQAGSLEGVDCGSLSGNGEMFHL